MIPLPLSRSPQHWTALSFGPHLRLGARAPTWRPVHGRIPMRASSPREIAARECWHAATQGAGFMGALVLKVWLALFASIPTHTRFSARWR
jgi:hypothetical protein